MASSSSLLHLIAAAASMALLISPALSLCKSTTSSNSNTTYEHCMDLPTLNAFLRWTHNPTATPRPTLSIAFTVDQVDPNLWVAWALNPTQTGMLGAQALIATRNVSTYVVQTYNISSTEYSITQSNISYNVLNMSAEHVNGSTTIFATLELPDAKQVLNQVWQLGPLTVNGGPGMHNTTPENVGAHASLTLAGPPAGAPAGSPTGSPPASAAVPGPAAGEQGGNSSSTSGGARVRGGGLLYGVVLVLLWASYFGFI